MSPSSSSYRHRTAPATANAVTMRRPRTSPAEPWPDAEAARLGPPKPQPWGRRMVWGACTLLCLVTGAYAFQFVIAGFATVPHDIAANHFLSPGGLRLHIAVTAITITVAPWQFAQRLRDRFPLVHRAMGRIYLLSGFVGITTGTAIALGSSSGIVAGTGFLCLGLSWLTVTAVGLRAILAGNVDAHRRWMLRSFALILGGVTLRLYVPISLALGFDIESSYPVIAWINWVPNIVLMEWWIRRDARHRVSNSSPVGSACT